MSLIVFQSLSMSFTKRFPSNCFCHFFNAVHESYSNDPSSNGHREACWQLRLVGSGNSKALLRSYLSRCHCMIRGQTAGKNPTFHRVFCHGSSCFQSQLQHKCAMATIGDPEWLAWKKTWQYCSNGWFQRETQNYILESANVKVEGRLVIAGARCKPSISTKTHTSGSVWRACTVKNLNRHQHNEIDGTEQYGADRWKMM